MNNNRNNNKQNHSKRKDAIEAIRELDSRVAYLYDKARFSRSREPLEKLYRGYKELIKAIKACRYYELLYTNVKNVEALLRRNGFFNQSTNSGKKR